MNKPNSLQRYNAICLAEDYKGNPLPTVEEIVLDCCNTKTSLNQIIECVSNKIKLEIDSSIKSIIIRTLNEINGECI